MSTYNVTVTREDRWWLITVDGVGVTQARHLDEVDEQASGLVEAMTGEVGAEIRARIEVPDDVSVAMAEARRLRQAADEAQTAAAQRIRTAVRGLLAAGLPQVDIARLLGVSRQRVTQLAKQQAAPTQTRIAAAKRATPGSTVKRLSPATAPTAQTAAAKK